MIPRWPTPIPRGQGRAARDRAMRQTGRWLALLIVASEAKKQRKEKQG